MQWEFNQQSWLPRENQTRGTDCGHVLGPTIPKPVMIKWFLYTLSSHVVISTCTTTSPLSLAPPKSFPPFELVAAVVLVVLDSNWSVLYPWPTESTHAPLLRNAIVALRFVFARLLSRAQIWMTSLLPEPPLGWRRVGG